MGETDEKRWKVGELAKATGLTVRTLHHYDELRLLVPSERTTAGHRLYAGQDVRRLYRILALRRLGFRLDEIAALLDGDRVSLLETVRRHLEQVERDLERQHRLRERLRQLLKALERSLEPAVDEFIDAMEAMTMIETSVEDVLMHLPGEEADPPPPRLARESHRVVLLRERGGERVLPIWIGAQEGDALVHERSGRRLPRPLGPDLTARLLQAGGVRVERVVIESLRENTYYASISVRAGGEPQEVDARPSDALNLALRLGAPVFVAADVMDESGVLSHPELRSRLSDAEAEADARGDAETQGDWRSVSPDLIWSLYPESSPERMLERCTERAREALLFAHQETLRLKHLHVGPDHILLGLLGEGKGLAARVLGFLGITLESVHARVVRTGGSSEDAISQQMTLTPKGRKVLALALSEALSLGPSDIDTEHILLALAREDEQVLTDFGVDAERLREEVFRRLGPSSANDPSAGRAAPSSS
jgi:bifunctional DNase/RNase/DNA-binding transcriptional MerR regulator